MCLNARTIFNKSTYLSAFGSPLRLQVPCGHCAECEQNRQNVYSLRSYYEWQESKAKGGFAYFECLTFNKLYLPIKYNIACFSREAVKKFLNRLKKNVFKKTGSYSAFSYIIAEEYGGEKHRPHIHIIIFTKVSRSLLSPSDLDICIRKSWMSPDPPPTWKFIPVRKYRGRWLDRNNFFVSQKTGRVYLLVKRDKKVFSIPKRWNIGRLDEDHTSAQKVISTMGAVHYCTKYIQKDQDFQSVMDKHIVGIKLNSGLDSQELKKVIHDMSPHHYQSTHFGLYLLTCEKLSKIMSGVLRIPFYNEVKPIALPQYFKYRLFYDKIKDNNVISGFRYRLNELGIKFRMNRLYDLIDHLAIRYSNMFATFSLSLGEAFKNSILSLMNGRSFHDFAKYLILFKDRLNIDHISFDSFCPEDVYKCSLVPEHSYKPFDNLMYDYSNGYKEIRLKLSQNVINETFSPIFLHFDALEAIFQRLTAPENQDIDNYSKYKLRILSRLKLFIND